MRLGLCPKIMNYRWHSLFIQSGFTAGLKCRHPWPAANTLLVFGDSYGDVINHHGDSLAAAAAVTQ